MADMDGGFTLDRNAFLRTRDAVRRLEAIPRNTARPQRGDRHRSPTSWINEGVLDGALAAPAAIDPPTTATLSIYRRDTFGVLVDTGVDLTVTNRDPNFEANAGDFLGVRFIANEWRPTHGGPAASGGQPIGPTVRIDTPGQIAYTLGAGVVGVLVNTVATGGSVTITLPASSDGHVCWIRNIGALMFRTVSVVSVSFTQGSTAIVTFGPGGNIGVLHEGPTGRWWAI